jgi:UDP-GlcNAc:undecaprenyl-phosphate/decaprenyl-phosphate GlcNAc-1-phosphate transferase
MLDISYLLRAMVVALFLIFPVSWISIQLTFRLKLIDTPGTAMHKIHASPKPIAGGIAMLAALLVTAFLFQTGRDHDLLVMTLGAMVIFAFSLWDDARNLPPWLKLVGQGVAVVVLIWLDVYVRFFESPEFFIQLPRNWAILCNWALTFIWIIGITNAFNLIDSMDGLAVGLGGIASAFFMLMALEAGQPLLALQLALLLGVCAGLYFFNSPPAIFFLGDSGAQTLGFLLAVMAILYTPQGANQSSSWMVPVLVLAMPIFDTTMVIISRLRRGHPIYNARLDHTYHRLVNWGIPSNRAVLSLHLTALIFGSLALFVLDQPPFWANAIFISCLLIGAVLIILLDHRERWL